MNNFAALIKQRRSIRQFTEQLLTPEETELILRAALMAPSSKRGNPWRFVVVEDKEMLKRLAECKEHSATFLEGCALAIVVAADATVSDVWVEDASIASIYMQLQAEDLGLGSCWCQVRNRTTEQETDSNEYVRQLLDLPYQLEVLSIIGFGHKAQERKPFDEEKLQWEKVHVGKMGTNGE
ncbi:FMN reductase (NADPH) [Bacteroidales bacterium Barb6XT]|nr:FMN reductase (NADPH) [Bacteroidales bacterium Barb6XT]OAV70403.1 FMN reductase (NADPH) [Bacteroidales bacterium Barb4]